MFSELEVFEALIPAADVDAVHKAVAAQVTAPQATYADIQAAQLAEFKKRGYSITVSKPA